MKMTLIAVNYDSGFKNILGFRILDQDSGQVVDQPYNAVAHVINRNIAPIIGIKSNGNNGIEGSNGAFSRYTKLVDGKYYGDMSDLAIVILNNINGEGYTVCNHEGKIARLREGDILKLLGQVKIANGKVVTRSDGTKFISAINGTYEKVELPEQIMGGLTEVTKEEADEAKKNMRAELSEEVRRGIIGHRGYKITGTKAKESKLKEVDERYGMTVEEKLAYTMLAMRRVRAFYYSMLASINKVESDEVPTMAVSIDTLYYSSEFVKEMTLPELLFVELHEILHLAMRHNVRKGTRNHRLWNMACDFYINKVLAEEFNLPENGEPVMVQAMDPSYNNKYKIALPRNLLYAPDIDTAVDTPESIYNDLEKMIIEADQGQGQVEGEGQGQGEGQGEGQGDGQGGGQGQGSCPKEEDQNKNGEGQEGKGGKSQQGKPCPYNGECDKKDSDGNCNKDGYKGFDPEKQRQKGTLIGKEYKGGIIKDPKDLVEDNKSAGMSETSKKQLSNSVLGRAVTRHKQSGNSFGGDTADYIERIVEEALAPKVNWRSLLKAKLTKATQKINTFASPDKRFRSRGMIMPGPKALENDALENVKVCIDTSGSITSEDLGIALAQISQMLKVFHAEAELIYWDTRVRAVYPFKDIKDLLGKKPVGGGGTDVNCVFDYFKNSPDYKKRRKQQPSIIIIFTDGGFGPVEKEFYRYKDTIWIINGDYHFNEPFGVKAKLKYND